jgi:hypothetical protein
MKCIYWNIRGVGNLETQLHLFQMIKTHKPDFLFLAEPLISFNSFPSWFWKKLNLHNHALNNNNSTPTLWCLWNKNYNISVLFNGPQCIALTYLDEGAPIYIAAIYASTFYINGRTLWLSLSTLLHDHFPLLLTVHKIPPVTIVPRFKFFKSWTTFDSCENIISEHWSTSFQGTPMHILHYKLKSLKPKLQLWSKTVVGNYHQKVHLAQQQLSEAQLAIDQLGYSLERFQDELVCLTNYSQALNLLNSYWQDKNKQTRFLEGDRNTAFSTDPPR